jgi:hypothetical protein
MLQFDPNIPGQNPGDPSVIEGNITTLEVVDPALNFWPLERGNHVLDTKVPFTVKVEWTLKGWFAPVWLQALGGNWNVQLFAESIGGGPEILLAARNDVAASGAVLSYAAELTVPPFKLPEGNPGDETSGIYKLVASVFLNSNLSYLGHGYDMIGFSEGPIIQVENPQ